MKQEWLHLEMNGHPAVERLLQNMTSEMEVVEKEATRAKLARVLNDLILHDFDGLVRLLYHIDINETRLKLLLQENGNEDAGVLLANLVLERHLQKLEARKKTPPPGNAIPDDERW